MIIRKLADHGYSIDYTYIRSLMVKEGQLITRHRVDIDDLESSQVFFRLLISEDRSTDEFINNTGIKYY